MAAGVQHNSCGDVHCTVIYKMSPIKLKKMKNEKSAPYLPYGEKKKNKHHNAFLRILNFMCG